MKRVPMAYAERSKLGAAIDSYAGVIDHADYKALAIIGAACEHAYRYNDAIGYLEMAASAAAKHKLTEDPDSDANDYRENIGWIRDKLTRKVKLPIQ